MKAIIKVIRYGSVIFLYISSLLFVYNQYFFISSSLLTALIFIIFSLALPYIYVKSEKFIEFFLESFSLFLIVPETLRILEIFSFNSDRINSYFGAFVFFVVLLAFSCSIGKYGFYNLQRIACILFVIPVIAICIGAGAVKYFSINDLTSSFSLKYQYINSFFCATLLSVDYFIVCRMQKNENCYDRAVSLTAYAFLVILIPLLSAFYKAVLSPSVLAGIISPQITCAGFLEMSEIKQVYMLIFGIIILFRLAVKISYIKAYFSRKTTK